MAWNAPDYSTGREQVHTFSTEKSVTASGHQLLKPLGSGRMKLLFRGTNGRDVYTSSRVCAQAVNPQAGAAVGWLRESSLQVYVGCLAVAAGGLAGLAWARGYGLGSPAAVAVLAVTAAIAETQRVWITRETEASISSIPTLFAAVLFGPIAALVVGAISNLGSFGRPYLKWGVFTCSRAIVGALSGFVA